MSWKRINWRKVLIGIAVLAVLAVTVGFVVWYKAFRQAPQPAWITSDQRNNFLYGSIGAEAQAGIPYWLWLVLPRMFPEYLPGPGGYASLGIPWEQGREMPAGFTKVTIGFPRVGNNCALCHALSYRTQEEQDPIIVPAGPGNTQNVQQVIEFFANAAKDPRFTADDIMAQVDLVTHLSLIDKAIYRFAIPRVRDALIVQGKDFAWAEQRPPWGPGRDAPMNLTKFNFLKMPMDHSLDNTDFPAIWHLSVREQPGRTYQDGQPVSTITSHTMLMNLDGATTSFRSVLIDSALGLGAQNTPFFNRRIPELLDWLRKFTPPKYPFPIDGAKASRGAAVFEAQCAACHAPGRDNRMGTVIPIEEIGTDPERLDAWRGTGAAQRANAKVASMGIHRTPMIETDGYIAVHLDGTWLRGPYLHNGSVPTVRDLLEPPAQRPKVFYRGYNVIDRDNVGFISTGPQGWRFDTGVRGNGNGGHLYGVTLSAAEKEDLLEYLKTL
jgi:mono/diheme cytochrome c family protein